MSTPISFGHDSNNNGLPMQVTVSSSVSSSVGSPDRSVVSPFDDPALLDGPRRWAPTLPRPSLQVTVLVGLLASVSSAAWAQGSAVANAAAAAPGTPAWQSSLHPAATGAPRVVNSGAHAVYPGNALVARVTVEIDRNALPADGQSATRVVVQLYGAKGEPLATQAVITVEASAGRVQLPGAKTDELGPGRQDADPATWGTQITVKGGRAEFNLLAPDTPQDVLLRVGAGAAQAEGLVSFVADARQLIAVGLVEGVVRLSRKDTAQLQSVRLEDGFESELRRFSRSFSDGKGRAAARTALYLKGKVLGEALLTAAFDSDKETRARMLRDIKPDQLYPVYGDSAIKGFDAQSSSRLYVRVDHDKSYALYGDFNTADGFGAAYGAGGTAPVALKSLGAYSRTLTGGRAHWRVGDSGASLGGFAAHDSLKQVSEEFRATGTSGPFKLRNNSALENSEKLELLVRSKDNPGIIKTQRILLRGDDYSFEPFSGRLLLNRPLASVDADGDPASLRVSYEVDQGGDRFWVGGLEASVPLGASVRVGASAVLDRNPVSPYKLGSAHVGVHLGEKTWLTAEVARSESTRYVAAGAAYSNPTQIAGEQRQDRVGNAARVALQHQGESSALAVQVARTQAGFDNPQAPLQAGRSEAQAQGSVQLNDTVKVFAQAVLGQDRSTGGERKGAALGAEVKLTDRLQVQAGLRKAQENGLWNGNHAGFAGASLTLNPSPGSSLQPSGGLFGGIDPVAVDPSSGQSITSLAATGVPAAGLAGQGIHIDSTTLFLGARFAATERLALDGLLEGDISGDNKHRVVLGAAYSVAERSRLTARYEDQSGITSAYGAARSNVFSVGADTQYMPGGQLFSEYRLRDATSRDAQWANGVRNTWSVREGVAYTTAFEYLKVLDGLGGNAAAVALGYDNTANALWKLGSKLEARRVFDNPRTPVNDRSDSLLSTVQVARKFSRDWTGLARNHLLVNRSAAAPVLGLGAGANTGTVNAVQDRFQLGAAYRPVDDNRLDVLSKYEYRFSRNAEQQLGLTERVHVGSVQAIYHPTRPYWLSGRLAAKARSETGLAAQGKTAFNAVLLAGRAVYDVTENIDLGVMAASLVGSSGRGRQSALGLEAGYLVQQNLWLSAGYNWGGFADRDLAGSDYTNGGVFVRLRFKFDEDLFAGTSRNTNRALDR